MPNCLDEHIVNVISVGSREKCIYDLSTNGWSARLKEEHFDVARTRKCSECGSDEEMRGLALHPSSHGV